MMILKQSAMCIRCDCKVSSSVNFLQSTFNDLHIKINAGDTNNRIL